MRLIRLGPALAVALTFSRNSSAGLRWEGAFGGFAYNCRLLFSGLGEFAVATQAAAQARMRDLSQNRAFQAYRSQRKVFLSLTTSPQRIQYVSGILSAFNPADYDGILVSIPETFARTGNKYVIPDELRSIPKLRILQTKEDLGPAMKLINPVEEVRRQSQAPAMLITIDDDIAYSRAMINELGFAAHQARAVVAGAGAPYSYWGIHRKQAKVSPLGHAPFEDSQLTPVDVVEGFGAIAYPTELVPSDQIRSRISASPEARFSDDLVISYCLGSDNVPLFQFESPFFSRKDLMPLSYGKGPDALHRGAHGLFSTDEAPGVKHNRVKYQRTAKALPGLEIDR